MATWDIFPDLGKAFRVEPGYERLAAVLQEALDQAQWGKGLRHAEGKLFDEQDLVREAVDLGLAYPAGQARKKIKEAIKYHVETVGDYDAAVHELCGAIVSCGALVLAIRKKYGSAIAETTQVPGIGRGTDDDKSDHNIIMERLSKMNHYRPPGCVLIPDAVCPQSTGCTEPPCPWFVGG